MTYSWNEIDVLVDDDPIKLRDVAWELQSELAQVRADRDEWQRRAEKARAELAAMNSAIGFETNCLSCAATLNGAYEQTVRAEKAEAELERVRPVLDALKPWRQQFAPASYMSPPAEVLAAAYDAYTAGPGGCAGHTRAVAG